MEPKITMELTEKEAAVINRIREERALDEAEKILVGRIIIEASILDDWIVKAISTKNIDSFAFDTLVVNGLCVGKKRMHAAVIDVLETAEKHARDIRQNGGMLDE